MEVNNQGSDQIQRINKQFEIYIKQKTYQQQIHFQQYQTIYSQLKQNIIHKKIIKNKNLKLSQSISNTRPYSTHSGNTLNNSNHKRCQTSKFHRIHFNNSQIQSRTTLLSIKSIQTEIMMKNQEKQALSKEITALKCSMRKVAENVAKLRELVEKQTRKKEKYKKVTYLAKSVRHQTNHVRATSTKGFKYMTKGQQNTINQLKAFKIQLQKENQEAKKEIIEHRKNKSSMAIREHIVSNPNFKFNKLTLRQGHSPLRNSSNFLQNSYFTIHSNTQPHSGLQTSSHFWSKSTQNKGRNQGRQIIDHKILISLEKLLSMLEKRQPKFTNLLHFQCTSNDMLTINKQLLSHQQILTMNKIEQIENKFGISLQSVDKLILNIFNSLKNQNYQLERHTVQLNGFKQQAQIQLKQITALQPHFQHSVYTPQVNAAKIPPILVSQSKCLVKAVQFFTYVFLKFKYLIDVATTLNVQANCFPQYLSRINIFLDEDYKILSSVSCSQSHYDLIAKEQIENIITNNFREAHPQFLHEASLFFTQDLRNLLIVKRSWLMNKIQSANPDQIGILTVAEALYFKCHSIYQQKIKTMCKLFLDCWKSFIEGSNFSYEEPTLPSKNLFIKTQPRHKTIISVNQHETEASCTSMEPTRQLMLLGKHSENQQKIFDDDPNKMVSILEKLKNNKRGKFKTLNFRATGKEYKYNKNIVILDFPMKEE